MRTPIPDSPPIAAPTAPRDLIALVDTQRHGRPTGTVVTASVPVRAPRVDALLQASDLPWGFCFRSARGESRAGVGAAAMVPVVPELRRVADQVLQGCVTLTPGPAPRLYGGAAFGAVSGRPRGTRPGPWRAFGDGCFTLPRWQLTTSPSGEAWLSLALAAGRPERRDVLEAELDRILRHLDAPAPRQAPTGAPELVPLPLEEWSELVLAAVAAIRSGAFEKLVAARVTEVRFDEPIEPVGVLGALAAAHPRCSVFLFRRDGAAFVGASPETLVHLSHGELVTHALAGSRRVGEGDDAPLLASVKDRWEHEIVVREIVASLAPLCATVTAAPEPHTRRVRDIAHLETPIRAMVRPGVHALDVAAALHPTPAVGGMPRLDAVPWIEAHEHVDRGWYSGLVGWVDARGDGELAVAIRSGLLEDRRALVFAGAGIVSSSIPGAEYDETTLKMHPMLRALGAPT